MVFPLVLPTLSSHFFGAVDRAGTQQGSGTTQHFGRGSRNLLKIKAGESGDDLSVPSLFEKCNMVFGN